MIYITKQEGLYQNKVNSSLVFTANCKMDYWPEMLLDLVQYPISDANLQPYM